MYTNVIEYVFLLFIFSAHVVFPLAFSCRASIELEGQASTAPISPALVGMICFVFLLGLFWSGPVKHERKPIKTEPPNPKSHGPEAGSVSLSQLGQSS